jgi:hypothetical protein
MKENDYITSKDGYIYDTTTKTTLDTSFSSPAVATYFRVRAKKND